MAKLRTFALGVAALLTLAACGSTIQQGLGPNGSSEGSELSVPGSPGAGPGGGLSSTGPGGAGVGSTSGVPGVGGGATSLSPGGKRQPLKVGLMYSTDTNAALEAIGARTRVADMRVLQNTVIEYINKHGGVAGHPLVPSYVNISATDSPQAQSQTACTQWTQVDKVFAAMPTSSVQDNNVLRQCLHNAGTLGVYPNFYSETREAHYRQTPLWFETESLSLETWARVYVAGLAKQGFFNGSKIGLIYDEAPSFTAVAEQVLIPELRKAGANVIRTATSRIHGAADLGPGNAQMSSAVLDFNTAGVTHVMFFEVWQGWFEFAANAESQRWRPTYGFSSQNAMQIMIETGLVQTAQLVGSKLVSWNPSVDIRPQDITEWSRLKLCLQIFRQAGVGFEDGGSETFHNAIAACGLLALQDAARQASQPITAASLAQGFERLGASTQMAGVPTARFGAGRHYAAAGWRPGQYYESCTCYRYTGPVTKI